MRKTTAALFLLAAVLAAATPLASQTRPRRVSQPAEESAYSESQPRAALRQRTAADFPRAPRRSLGRTLFRVGMAAAVLGVAGRGGSCAPSRRHILLGGAEAVSRIPRDDRRWAVAAAP